MPNEKNNQNSNKPESTPNDVNPTKVPKIGEDKEDIEKQKKEDPKMGSDSKKVVDIIEDDTEETDEDINESTDEETEVEDVEERGLNNERNNTTFNDNRRNKN
jgi:hypothetical protein